MLEFYQKDNDMTLTNFNINDETKIRFIPFYPPLLTGTVIVWKKHQIFSPATARFIEKIKHSLKA